MKVNSIITVNIAAVSIIVLSKMAHAMMTQFMAIQSIIGNQNYDTKHSDNQK
jgi:hypothetical protein